MIILLWDYPKGGLVKALRAWLERLMKSLHTEAYSKFVAVLVAARTERGLTQQQVAERVGKPQSYIAKVEGAERRLDVIEFIALAHALGVDPTTLFKNVLNAESVY